MKNKNILLVVFFLTLFVFQQVQASARVPSTGSPSQINAAPANTNILFSTVHIYVYQLVPNSGALIPSHTRCAWPRDFGIFGCGADYPAGSLEPEGFLIVNVEQDYLRDVIATEMNLAQIVPDPEGQALKAQAIASRSVASWKSDNGPWDNGFGEPYGVWPRINNSNTYQVFIPGAHNTSAYKSAIDAAVDGTTGQFLQYVVGDNHVIDASFAADMLGAVTVDGDVSAPYLKGIQDPVSTGCVLDLGNAQYGMSQRGAIRWAKGNTCPDGTGAVWPVKWNHQQILVHYYTGVDIVNDNTGAKVAPDDRWNLLWHDAPSQMNSGQIVNINLKLQNTSAANWASGDVILGYQWTLQGAQINPQNWQQLGSLPSTLMGDLPGSPPNLINVAVIAPPTGGAHTLHLDLRHQNGDWFSNQAPNWPDAEIAVNIVGSTATPAPPATSTPLPTATAIPSSNYALRFQLPGSSHALFMPSAANLDFGADMTIEFWIRTTSTYDGGGAWFDGQWILDKDIGGVGRTDWAVTLKGGRIIFDNGKGANGSDGALYSAQSLNNGAWHHVAIVRNLTTGNGLTTIYIDGIQDASGMFSTTNISNTLGLVVGIENGIGGVADRVFRGDLDDLRLWNIPRAQPEIQGNMHSRLLGSEAGLVGYWCFDEGAGQLANDLTSFQIDGQLGDSSSNNTGDPEWILASELFTGATPTPIPTSTGPTSTPQPISTCPWEIWFFCSDGTSNQINSRLVAYRLANSLQEIILDVQLFYRVRDELLSTTSEGNTYIDLYYQHGPEISDIVSANPALYQEGVSLLEYWEPKLQALVDGQGGMVVITQAEVDAVDEFLSNLESVASASLQTAIQEQRVELNLQGLVGMPMDQAWIYLNGFPSTPVLDNFNRANGAIGSNWAGNPSKYSLASNQLLVTSNDANSDIYFSGQAFGADQEAHVTFANVHATAAEQDLILKAQSSTTWGSGMIEVLYDAPNQRVQVWTWEWPAGWEQHGADLPVTFVHGDTFGARALANGNVEVYKNGELLGTRDVTSWSYYAQGGYIGLWFVGAQNARLDDFGGGTLPSGMQALMESQAQANTPSANAFDAQVGGTSAFWQGIPLSETASVTITQIQTGKQILPLKPKSNGVSGESVVQVFYDLANGRIQVWVYDPAKGWTQIGKDFPIKFAVGDKFTIRAFADGRLDILRNDKLIAKTDVTP